MSELEAYLQQLSKAQGFTLEQLEANRAGQVHPSQLAASKGVAGPVAALVFAVASLGGGATGAVLYYEDASKPLERLDRNALVLIIGATVVVTAFFVGVFVNSLRARRRRVEAYARGAVTVVTTQVAKQAVRGGRGGPSTWLLHFGEHRFHVSEATWELVTHGATYRAFLVDGRLLSFEPVPSGR